MLANSLRCELKEIKLKSEKLEFDFKSVKQTTVDHCDKVKEEIKSESERQIKQLENKRDKLLKELDEYESSVLGQFETTFNQASLLQCLKDGKNLIAKCEYYTSMDDINCIKRCLIEAKSVLKRMDTLNQEIELARFGCDMIEFKKIEPTIGHLQRNQNLISTCLMQHSTLLSTTSRVVRRSLNKSDILPSINVSSMFLLSTDNPDVISNSEWITS